MILCFELTMPHANSWNGRWTGEDQGHYLFLSVGRTPGISQKRALELNGKYFTYRFGDGWVAGITVELIEGAEKRRRAKVNAGFCGYDWMVESIRTWGLILTSDQIKQRLGAQKEVLA